MSDPIIETRTAKVWLGQDGIVRITSRKTTPGTLADSREIWNAVKSASAGKIRPLFADIRNTGAIDSEGRRYYSRPETKELTTAVALLVESPISRVVGSFFLGINRLSVPIRIFTSEQQALTWLNVFLDDEKK